MTTGTLPHGASVLKTIAYAGSVLSGVLAVFSFAGEFAIPAQVFCFVVVNVANVLGLSFDANAATNLLVEYNKFIIAVSTILSLIVLFGSRTRE